MRAGPTRVAPAETSWPLSGWPVRCAPATNSSRPGFGEPFGEAGERPVAEGRAGEHHAERQPVDETGGDRQRRVVEQVREVREPAHPGVGADGVGGYLRDGRMPGRRRGEQRVAAVERGSAGGARAASRALVGGPVRGRPRLPIEDDRGDGRVQVAADLLGVRLQVRPDGGVALGDERAAVEQRGRVQQRGEVDLDDLDARSPRTARRRPRTPHAQPGASPPRCSGVGMATRGRGRCRRVAAARSRATGRRVGPLHDLDEGRGEAQLAGEDGDAVEAYGRPARRPVTGTGPASA